MIQWLLTGPSATWFVYQKSHSTNNSAIVMFHILERDIIGRITGAIFILVTMERDVQPDIVVELTSGFFIALRSCSPFEPGGP